MALDKTFLADRELLHKQLELLAEKSKDCSIEELVKISEQMSQIFTVLHNPRFERCSYTSQ